MKGGLGTASASSGNLVVGALVVVNCWGNVKDPVTGEHLGGTLNKEKNGLVDAYEEMKKKQAAYAPTKAGLTSHTTIGMVATNAILSKPMATRVAMMAHDGFSRAICPAHTAGEGDSIFAVTTGEVESDINIVGAMAADAMARVSPRRSDTLARPSATWATEIWSSAWPDRLLSLPRFLKRGLFS
jgi:L-aminopeptidase/D-esterase-like protein